MISFFKRGAGAAVLIAAVLPALWPRAASADVALPARAVLSTATPAPVTSPAAATGAAPTADPCGGAARLLATLNRPTVGYSACAVPPGSIVLEEGYQSQAQAGRSPSVAVAYPQGFERFGVFQGLEIDAIGPNANRLRAGNAVTTGYSDLGAGFKYELPQRGRFTFGIDGLFTGATGGSGFTSGGPTETLDVDVAYAASPAIGLGTTVAGASSAGFGAAGNAARFGYLLPSVVVTAQLPNYYQFYAELVGQTKLAPGEGGHLFTDFGLQKLLGPDLELDIEYGDSFTPIGGSRFHYVGVGTGLRVK